MKFDQMDELNSYIEECFVRAFKINKKEYNKSLYEIDFVIMHDKSNENEFMVPLYMWCKYQSVSSDALRLIKNKLKQFNLLYSTNDYSISVNGYNTYKYIDTDNSIASFRLSHQGTVILNVTKDTNKRRYRDFERYLNNSNEYMNKIHKYWNFFVTCYHAIYKYYPDFNYEFLCSEDVEQIMTDN